MNSIFPLDIFPPGALSSSVITTVWVGVFVVVMLNLRLGTTLSGLVVPGYLVPLIILRPMSSGVIVMEGLITYAVAYLLANRLPRMFSYSEMFGRDRFFALILISVIVRLIFDGLLLPVFGEYLLNIGFDYDYRNNLHSFGLIIVALIANQMWNGGIRYGATSIALYIGISYLIVRFILMEFTNFNISTMSYMYEDLASSILASPKAYIILLTSAFIASRMNVKYGWEFNGILIPSLLALQWYQPEKLIITFIEALIIYILAHFILKINIFKQLHIEGPKQILMFFNISFLYKLLLSFFIIKFMPNEKISDYYAFGYLLSTLLAVKMYQNDIAIRMFRATLQTSLTAVIAASVIGFSLTLIPFKDIEINKNKTTNTTIPNIESNFEQHLGKLRSALYTSEQTTDSGQANPIELDRLNSLFQLIKSYLQQPSDSLVNKITQLCNQLHLKATTLNDKYLIVEDNQPERGWGVYIWNINTKNNLIIEVPAPLDEPQASDAASSLYINFSAKALALAGTKRNHSSDGTSDTLKNSQTAFQLFHRNFALQNTLQIRQYTQKSSRRLLTLENDKFPNTPNSEKNQLWVKKSLPDNLNINTLDKILNNFDIQWKRSPLENRQQYASPQGFAELYLSAEGVRSILSFTATGAVFTQQLKSQRIDGYLLNWLKDNKKLIAARGSDSYIQSKLYEMLFFDQNIITPIMDMLRDELASGWLDNITLEMRRINNLAHALDYELIRYHHQSSGDDFIILQEIPSTNTRHWGTYVFRIGPAAPYMIEVPRPLSEINTLEFGAGLFEKLNARALLIAGTHPYANFDGSANLLHHVNKVNLFNLVHQVVLRQHEDNPLLVLQLRAFSNNDNTPSSATDVLMAKLGPFNDDFPLLTSKIEKALNAYGLYFKYVTGSLDARGYEVSWNAQARYSPMTENKPFYVLWVSPKTRRNFLGQEDSRQQYAKFLTLGINTLELDIASWANHTKSTLDTSIQDVNKRVDFTALKQFINTDNIVMLKRFIDQHNNFLLQRLIDINTRQAYLAVNQLEGGLLALVNLKTQNEKPHLISSDIPSRKETQKYIDARARWFIRKGLK